MSLPTQPLQHGNIMASIVIDGGNNRHTSFNSAMVNQYPDLKSWVEYYTSVKIFSGNPKQDEILRYAYIKCCEAEKVKPNLGKEISGKPIIAETNTAPINIEPAATKPAAGYSPTPTEKKGENEEPNGNDKGNAGPVAGS